MGRTQHHNELSWVDHNKEGAALPPGSKEPGFRAEDGMKSKQEASEIPQNGLGNLNLTAEQIMKTKLNTGNETNRASEIILDDQILYGPVRESIIDLYISLCQKDLASFPAQLALAWQLHKAVVETESNQLKTHLTKTNEITRQQEEALERIQKTVQAIDDLHRYEDEKIQKCLKPIEKQLSELALKSRIQGENLNNLTHLTDQNLANFKDYQKKIQKTIKLLLFWDLLFKLFIVLYLFIFVPVWTSY